MRAFTNLPPPLSRERQTIRFRLPLPLPLGEGEVLIPVDPRWGLPKHPAGHSRFPLGRPHDPPRAFGPCEGASPKTIPSARTARWGFPKDHSDRGDQVMGFPHDALRPTGPGDGASPKSTPTDRTWRWGFPTTEPDRPDLAMGRPRDRTWPTGPHDGASPLHFGAPRRSHRAPGGAQEAEPPRERRGELDGTPGRLLGVAKEAAAMGLWYRNRSCGVHV